MIVSKRVIITAALAAAVWLTIGSAAPSAALAASTRVVDNDYPSATACKGAAYATIQAAVDSFTAGQSGTIKVCAGVYPENVSISGLGKIKLVGRPGAAIIGPSTSPLIAATNTTLLTVQGFTLDGAGTTSSGNLLSIQNGSGVVTKNVFQNCMNNNGVYASITTGAWTLKVTNNDFTNVSGGVYVVSAGGAIVAKVTGNDVTGSGDGVAIGAAPAGSVTATVSGNRLQGSSTGIQLQAANKATVSGNKIEGFSEGIRLTDSSLARVSKNKVRTTGNGISIIADSANAGSNKVTGNTLEAIGNGFVGVDVSADTGMAADFNQITGNTITDPGALYTGPTGIRLDTSGGSMDGTVIKSNKLVNMDTPYFHTGDTGTIISRNKCAPATPCVAL